MDDCDSMSDNMDMNLKYKNHFNGINGELSVGITIYIKMAWVKLTIQL